MLGKSDAAAVRDLRSNVEDVAVPFLDTVSQPADLIANGVEEFRHWLSVGDENSRLREERLRLLQWEAIARKLEAENEQLRQLLRFPPPPDASFVTARIVSDTAGMFARSVLVNAGQRHGVDKHNIVLADRGVVGRIINVSEMASRVLLVTDLNSRIPVYVGPLRTRAILSGDNTDHPKLIHLPPNTSISVGDRIVTSGHGGVFPPGLSLGLVSATAELEASVDPYVNFEKIEFVRIAEFTARAIPQATANASSDSDDPILEDIGPVPLDFSWPVP